MGTGARRGKVAVNGVECDFDLLGRNFILQNLLLKKTGFPSFNYAVFTDLCLFFTLQKELGHFYKEPDTEFANSFHSLPLSRRVFWEQDIFNLMKLSETWCP